ncbi:SAM-dependent methyltransferase [Bacillus sp. JCM 19046]|nr:SAM-dependent methyltransferase [Bacillus sp. JCM 19045]GAF15842.1 SAM-dependent methyltransferase [Bacillus sp. JCM 19046]
MGIDFHSKEVGTSYASREADVSWRQQIKNIINIRDKTIIDIGCGGGIYTKAFAELGASHVIGVDFSREQLANAAQTCESFKNISFQYGSATQTGLSGTYDIVFEKAVIHHTNDITPFFQEAYSLLKSGGTFIVQDRTPEDCLLPGTETHVRGYFFEAFPALGEKEKNRRHSSNVVLEELHAAGFSNVQTLQLWETRKQYIDKKALLDDLRKRTGRSILYELSDEQLDQLITKIDQQLAANKTIHEKDRWSIWVATK